MVWSATIVCGALWTAACEAATLQWDRNPEPNVAGYKVYYGLASYSYNAVTNVGNETSWVLPLLQTGTEYFFAVTAYDSEGLESEFSEEVSYTPVAKNTPPTITGVPDQNITWNSSSATLSFTVDDAETEAGTLHVTAESSNPSLIPIAGILLEGSGSNRMVRVTPAESQHGTSVVTLTVSDGSDSAQTSFSVTVGRPPVVEARSFTNSTPIAIPDSGRASVYPSTMDVGGLEAEARSVVVTLYGLTHGWPDDLDVLLVAPSGRAVVLISDAGGNIAVTNVTLTLSRDAAEVLPDRGSVSDGIYLPANYGWRDLFPSPAPTQATSTDLALSKTESPNGTWSLFILDDGKGGAGSLLAWSLTIGPAVAPSLPAVAESIAADEPREAPNDVAIVGRTIDGCVMLQVRGQEAQKYRVEVSEDLTEWSTIGSFAFAHTGTATFPMCEPPDRTQRFYRLAEDW